ncbi:hypothetical protein JYG23_12240 [Sedimentibacter sp. zth1]|uniref:hypothetical protein n=1 Tax=Sedimentibacter sp. zth1 TaxID=2816908 RepID=UPI001A933002|nr:hypothetical protein [Sedimentibacter sp. zth1]QSX05437.1 hypothetical protein JYG23_12240 [Sedimentibacter sp. zth1]
MSIFLVFRFIKFNHSTIEDTDFSTSLKETIKKKTLKFYPITELSTLKKQTT